MFLINYYCHYRDIISWDTELSSFVEGDEVKEHKAFSCLFNEGHYIYVCMS